MYHADKVERYSGTNEELAEDLGNLKYGRIAYIIGCLADKVRNDAEKDRNVRGRKQLSSRLERAVSGLSEAEREFMQAWRICEPHMKETQAEQSSAGEPKE